MERRILFASLACLVLLTGCNFIQQFIRPAEEEPVQEEPVAEEPVKKKKKKKPKPVTQEEKQIVEEYGEKGGAFKDYQQGVIGNGDTAILFFSASWCPDCQRHEAQLKDWYSVNYIPLSVYRVDYDSEVDLKQRYGVIQQDTFVRIDGGGNAVDTKTFPNDLDLLNMLRP